MPASKTSLEERLDLLEAAVLEVASHPALYGFGQNGRPALAELRRAVEARKKETER